MQLNYSPDSGAIDAVQTLAASDAPAAINRLTTNVRPPVPDYRARNHANLGKLGWDSQPAPPIPSSHRDAQRPRFHKTVAKPDTMYILHP